MSIRLSFSTVACPDWTIDQVAKRAAEMGYQGVELRTLGPGGTGLASDPALSDPQRVRDALGHHGIEAVCLTTGLYAHHHDLSADREAQLRIAENINLAVQLGCPYVQVFAGRPDPNQDRKSIIRRMAESIHPLGRRAAEAGVTLLLENEPAFSVPKEWWWLLESVHEPSVGICWNLPNAAAANQDDNGGWVAVPTLNSRIRMAKVYDAVIGPNGGFTNIGDGTVAIEGFIKRLLGIGYQGYLSVEWNRLWFEGLTPADQFLPAAYERLRGWIDQINPAGKQEKQAKPEKAEAPAGAGT